MYLVARIFGIATYVLTLFLALWLVRNTREKSTAKILLLFLVLLCCIAFFYEPAPEADLYRSRQYAQNFARYSWSDFFQAIANGEIGLSDTPLAAVLYKILGSIGLKGIIAAFSCWVCFSIIFYSMNGVKKRYELSGACVALALLWFLSADYYMPTIATIRSYMAAALVFFCIYREARQGKTGVLEIILYIAAILLHAGGIALVFIRFAAVVFQKGRSFTFKLLYIAVMLAVLCFAFVLYQDTILSSVNTGLSYLFSKNSAAQYSYRWEQIILAIMLVTQVHTLYAAKQNGLDEEPFMSAFYAVSRISVAMMLPAILQFTFFMRLSYFTSLVELPLVLRNNADAVDREWVWSVNLLTVCAAMMLLLTCSRGYLCSLKFWE